MNHMNPDTSLVAMDGPLSLQEYDEAAESESLLSWDELYQKLYLSPRNRPSIVDGSLVTSNLSSLLSASSYPESLFAPAPRIPDPYAQVPMYGGYQLEGPPRPAAVPRELPRAQRRLSDPMTLAEPTEVPKKPKRQRTEAAATEASARKRGRPRKNMEGQLGEDPEERRRMQIRLAQRAYRSRKEANISSLKGRIAQLESAVERMSTTVISFSDELVQSGVLASHADLTGHLRETVQTCLDLAKEASEDHDVSDLSPGSEKSSRSLSRRQSNGPAIPSDPKLPLSPSLSDVKDSLSSPRTGSDTSSPSENIVVSHMELSAFMERLHMACLYQAYLVLANPAIPMDRLKRPFLLLFTIMDRTRMISFFQAALLAKVGQSRLDEWREVPFFYLGGAGSHYPRSSSQKSPLEMLPLRYSGWETIQDPLALLSPETRRELDGEWFDIQDLEGFLREKNVQMFVSRPQSNPSSLSINVARFIPALINKALCLGRTPGFRRHDVEKALRVAAWA